MLRTDSLTLSAAYAVTRLAIHLSKSVIILALRSKWFVFISVGKTPASISGG